MADLPGSGLGPLRPSYPVRTERLLLRPLSAGDADALLAYRGRDDVSRYVPFEPMSRDDILERIAGAEVEGELLLHRAGQRGGGPPAVAIPGQPGADALHRGARLGALRRPRSAETV